VNLPAAMQTARQWQQRHYLGESIIDEDNYYIVSCPVFKGCHSYGKTIDEAMNNIREVVEMCVEEMPVLPRTR